MEERIEEICGATIKSMYTIFTIDVEGHVGNDPVEHLIYGKTKDSKLCGIDMLMDILDAHSIQGLFFVDIAEAWDYGTDKITEVLRHIKARGHDVGVHIHPDHMADKKRLFLSEYTYEEQYDIISKCTDFYKCVLGEAPVAFRAGKYGANRDTLNILSKLGYKADFSEFYGQKWCHINPPVAKVNVQKVNNSLLVIPVTSYISLDVGFYSRHDKVDCGQTVSEFRTLIKNLSEKDNDVVVLFAHSFSLLDWRRTPNKPKFKRKLKKRLEKQLDFLDGQKEILNLNLEKTIRAFDNYVFKDMNEDTFITLKGIRPIFWFLGRAKSVLKSKFDIRFRKM